MRGAWLLVLAGCYDPRIAAGTACSPLGECPAGLVCIAEVCVPPGTAVPDGSMGDAAIDAPGSVDAAPDAPTHLAPVAHWRFDDDPSDGVLDSSGRGHTGTCITTCPTLGAGHIGMAYTFSPAEATAIRVPDDADFRGSYTIAAWVNAGATVSDLSIMAKVVGVVSANSWQLELLDSGKLSLSGGSPHYLQSPADLPRGTWHHVAGTWDGTTKRLFIDGAPVAEVAATASFDAGVVVLGADQNGGNPALYWDGGIDDVRIYDRVLSNAELAALAQP